MPKVVLVRHGQTHYNRLGLIQGRVDTELNSKGIAQAEALAVRLKDESIDAVYSSPLRRAMQTAQIIVKDRDLAIKTDERLVEVDQGEWTHKKGEELYRDLERYREWVADPTSTHPPGGEDVFRIERRARSFLKEAKGENILVVSHGGLIAVMHTVISGEPLINAWKYLPANGQVFRLAYERSFM